MFEVQINGLDLMGFSSLAAEPGLAHAVTTRNGGANPDRPDHMNLAFGHGEPDMVRRNLDELQLALGLDSLVFAKQVHGVEIAEAGPGATGRIAEADGLVTTTPGVGLLIKQADCQAVILYEPEAGVLANLHVGWRGNVQNMPAVGVDMLRHKYNADPAKIRAAISPSLGACCGEFVNWRDELPGWFSQFRVNDTHFDLVEATKAQLTKCGMRPENIEASGLCTKCDHRFFSYRRDGVTGRFGTIAALRPNKDHS